MTRRIEEILSRALLVRHRTVPRDIVPFSPRKDRRTQPPGEPPHKPGPPNAAAEDLRALCETLVTHTPATAVTDFVTDQVPEPRSALVLACVLQLTDTDAGARFWWQYAAGAGQAAAAYCLYLHHLALGESDTADWWHRQTDDVQPPPGPPAQTPPTPSTEAAPSAWHPADHRITSTSTTTILRILRHLAKYSTRPRSAAVTELMAYVPTAVAVGYLNQPDMDLPTPGADFARRISTLLATAANRPDVTNTLPARPDPREHASHDAAHSLAQPSSAESSETARRQVGETAKR
ncbi:hypothetical protein [Streptomyces canus]|uniref:hypothetical protein n=1 Tax=Streptomyces canus TaxID=58343 RepID=UPI002DDA60DC|nr:hypothetical protein [Streptomyces canus]WSD82863.1 hypothetical protein OG925_00140 [Streptomyces canus]WSD91971.1 hypothetical protein OG925_50340 [Streptomyces canus]WSD92538.1 hypothetical protein OG925_50615 [Streptomyces canus]